MKARWNQHRLQGVCPENLTDEEDGKRRGQGDKPGRKKEGHRAGGAPETRLCQQSRADPLSKIGNDLCGILIVII